MSFYKFNLNASHVSATIKCDACCKPQTDKLYHIKEVPFYSCFVCKFITNSLFNGLIPFLYPLIYFLHFLFFNVLSFYINRLFWYWFIHFKRKPVLVLFIHCWIQVAVFLFIPYWLVIIIPYFNFDTKSFQSATCLNAGQILLLFCALSLVSFLLLLACFVREQIFLYFHF